MISCPSAIFWLKSKPSSRREADIAVATGLVLADGIHGPGIPVKEGLEILARDRATGRQATLEPVYNAYGCNMVFRVSAIEADATRFDENLPLYGWQEDVDFCRRLARHGRIVRSATLRGVHLGNKRGRTSGLRFGYSQVANPLYLFRKGTVGLGWALKLLSSNIAANIVGSLKSQGLVDRRGRLKGNLIALVDLLRGRIDPLRTLRTLIARSVPNKQASQPCPATSRLSRMTALAFHENRIAFSCPERPSCRRSASSADIFRITSTRVSAFAGSK